MRIAMWSGPRNISTALMRAWENRPDAWVVDEPLYAHYLTQVTVAHPGVDEVIQHHDGDWERVVAGLTGPIPHGRAVYYQKHMAHHWLPHLRGEWVFSLTNAFLIRDPAEMLQPRRQDGAAGAPRHRAAAAGRDLPRRAGAHRRDAGRPRFRGRAEGPARRARPVLRAGRRRLRRAMLHWPPGRRATDGIWAKYWYDAVERSTGFEPWSPRPRQVAPELEPLLAECLPYYEELAAHRLRA